MITFLNILCFVAICAIYEIKEKWVLAIGFLLIALSQQIRLAIEKSKK